MEIEEICDMWNRFTVWYVLTDLTASVCRLTFYCTGKHQCLLTNANPGFIKRTAALSQSLIDIVRMPLKRSQQESIKQKTAEWKPYKGAKSFGDVRRVCGGVMCDVVQAIDPPAQWAVQLGHSLVSGQLYCFCSQWGHCLLCLSHHAAQKVQLAFQLLSI